MKQIRGWNKQIKRQLAPEFVYRMSLNYEKQKINKVTKKTR